MGRGHKAASQRSGTSGPSHTQCSAACPWSGCPVSCMRRGSSFGISLCNAFLLPRKQCESFPLFHFFPMFFSPVMLFLSIGLLFLYSTPYLFYNPVDKMLITSIFLSFIPCLLCLSIFVCFICLFIAHQELYYFSVWPVLEFLYFLCVGSEALCWITGEEKLARSAGCWITKLHFHRNILFELWPV